MPMLRAVRPLVILGALAGVAASTSALQPPRPAKSRVHLPEQGAVDAKGVPLAPPRFVITSQGTSVTWSEASPDGSVRTLTAASADGQSYSLPVDYDAQILMRYASFDPINGEPSLHPALVAGADSTVYIVQFTGAIVPGMLSDLVGAGATPRAYLPNFAYIATVPAEALARVRALPSVRAVVPYHPAYRLDESVLATLFPAQNLASGPDPAVLYNIQVLTPGPSLKPAIFADVAAAGGTMESATQAGAQVKAWLTRAQLVNVLRSNAVLFVDPAGAPEGDMDVVRQATGAVFVQDTLGFTGQGVRALVVDDNVRATHAAFQSPPLQSLTDRSGDTPHGTSCYGILFGSGATFPQGRGLMPSAEQGYFADYDFMTDRVALAQIAGSEAFPFRCVLQSNSWGHPWTTNYTTDSAEMDLAAFSSGMLIVQSQSNSGNTWSRPEAWAKNVISVGGIVHYNTPDFSDDCYCGLASRGPAADGRVKPDLALFNDQVATTAAWADYGYTFTFSGTSAATACVAGIAGLVYQMWHEGVFAGFGGGADVFASRPAAATVRALLASTAFRYEFSGPTDENSRYRQGWGVPRLDRLYKVRQGMIIVDQSIPMRAGDAIEFPFIVPPDTAELSTTMAYRDPPGTTSSLVHRINDLTLLATSPTGVEYWGNAGLILGNVTVPAGSPDTRNLIENIFVPKPEAGVWTIAVFAAEVNQDARPQTPELDADFSLVINNRVVNYCEADWNHDEAVNSTDVSDFVNDWFTDLFEGSDRTDVDRNGVVNSTDVSVFINSYFEASVSGCG
jgi:hypothetical protein